MSLLVHTYNQFSIIEQKVLIKCKVIAPNYNHRNLMFMIFINSVQVDRYNWLQSFFTFVMVFKPSAAVQHCKKYERKKS